jgi:hypothetical protein
MVKGKGEMETWYLVGARSETLVEHDNARRGK